MGKILDSVLSGAGAGLISGGISTIGNLLGAGKQFDYQQRLAEQQFNYNKQLLQMQMDYNNPSNQMAMYRSAGINPYAALGNNTSVGSSSVGQGSAPNIANIGSQAIDAFNSAYTVDSQRQQMLANARSALSQSKALDADALKKLSEVKGIDIQNDILKTQAQDFKNKINLENKLVMSQIAATESQATLYELLGVRQIAENANYRTIVTQNLAESAARIKLMAQQGELTKAQAVQCLAGAMLSNAQTVGVNISNRIANSLALDYIEKFGLDIKEQKERIEHYGKDNQWYEFNHSIGSLFNGLGLFISPSSFVGRKVVSGFK